MLPSSVMRVDEDVVALRPPALQPAPISSRVTRSKKEGTSVMFTSKVSKERRSSLTSDVLKRTCMQSATAFASEDECDASNQCPEIDSSMSLDAC